MQGEGILGGRPAAARTRPDGAGVAPPPAGNPAPVILGYPDDPTVTAGGRIVLRVSTDAPAFRVLVYRCGARTELVQATDWLPGRSAPRLLPFEDWDWPAHALDVPADRAPGVHVAVLVEGDGRRWATPDAAPDPDARTARALFVVRAPAERRPRVLYKLPLLTYHAYNLALPDPGRAWSLYSLPDPRPGGVPPTVSVRRPGGGTGGTPWDVFNHDPFDPSPRQTFRHWDAPFLAWLERHGVAVDLCTDLDLHRDPALLDGCALLLSAGHDEYWTDAMRERTEGFVADGGNVAFFGGNTCWWRVEFDDAHAFRRVANWWDPAGPDRPENHLTGVSFRNGGERDRDDHPVPVGYRVQHTDHWVWEGTGLADGDVLGGRPGEYLVGYEADGAHFDRSRTARGLPARATGDDGTPADFTILGVGDIAPGGWGNGNAAATMGLHGGGGRAGTVFTASTTDWPRLLAGGTCPAVEQVTHTVVSRLSARVRASSPAVPAGRRA